MSKAQKAKSLKKLIADFRLTAARVTLGYLAHMPLYTSDMRDMSDMAELCEQYSLLIALNWFATRYGFPVCIESMHSDSSKMQFPLLSWASLANRYPLSAASVLPIPAAELADLFSFMDKCFPENLEFIGDIYQQMLSAPLAINDQHMPYIDLQSDARVSGEFYTPAWVADHAFEQWLSALSANALKRVKDGDIEDLWSRHILDPSCGTGNFLLGALRLASHSDAKDILKYGSASLYGRDIDGRAIEIAKILLAILAVGLCRGALHAPAFPDQGHMQCAPTEHEIVALLDGLDRNVRVSDSLLQSCINDGDEEFDLIITNPPYISFGSRDQQRISKDWQSFLKARFPASSEYKLRFTSIFQEIGIELLKGDGHCIFLVPDAFLTGSFYQRLRALICRQVDIVGLTELNESTIPGATVGRWCLAHYKNKNDQFSDLQVRLQSIGIDEPDSKREFVLPLSSLLSKDKQRFQLVFCREDLEIIDRCREFPFLKECIRGHTGIRARNGQASIIAKKQASGSHFPGLISGSELSAFKIDWRGNFIEVVPERLFSGGFDPEIIENPKILVRQTGDRLVAATDQSGLYHLNNVHSFVPSANTEGLNSIYFYTCLLNSSFFLYFYRLKTREHKRALAQIDIETVEHLPLPPRNSRIEKELAKIGKVLSNDQSSKERNRLLSEMDELVFQMFDLKTPQRAHVLASL